MKKKISTQVLIIGGGVSGTGLALDLALRGIQCTLIEKKDINAGASGSNHGLLHSGARYVSNDPESAKHCAIENRILKQMVPQFIDDTGGIFAAVEGDDEAYIADFPNLCTKVDIPCQPLDIQTARELEPTLSKKTIAAYLVEDATIDPFGLSLQNLAQAESLGAEFYLHTQAVGFKKIKDHIESVQILNCKTGKEFSIYPKIVVNAAGAWSGLIASLAGCSINMIYSKGSLLVSQTRISDRVINRLRPPSDGDILVPGGTVSILGTTSVRIDSLDRIKPTVEETDYIVDTTSKMIPSVNTTRFIRAYSGVRPLIMEKKKGDDRSVSRDFALFDHQTDGLSNFITITGGKLTTYRYMAEKTADMVCQKLDILAPCLTADISSANIQSSQLTVPGHTPRQWMQKHQVDDFILCECEMVPKSAVNEIIQGAGKNTQISDLKSIGLRSRIGKGSCQGAFCSIRLLAHLYEQSCIYQDQGIPCLKEFLQERWMGQHSILWGKQLKQAELTEAVHCGFFNMEM